MKEKDRKILLALNKRIIDIIDASSDLYFKEHAFLLTGGPAVITELSEEDKRRDDQLDRDLKAALKEWDKQVERIFPTPKPKQGELI